MRTTSLTILIFTLLLDLFANAAPVHLWKRGKAAKLIAVYKTRPVNTIQSSDLDDLVKLDVRLDAENDLKVGEREELHSVVKMVLNLSLDFKRRFLKQELEELKGVEEEIPGIQYVHHPTTH